MGAALICLSNTDSPTLNPLECAVCRWCVNVRVKTKVVTQVQRSNFKRPLVLTTLPHPRLRPRVQRIRWPTSFCARPIPTLSLGRVLLCATSATNSFVSLCHFLGQRRSHQSPGDSLARHALSCRRASRPRGASCSCETHRSRAPRGACASSRYAKQSRRIT